MREIVLDTETTGLDPIKGHRLVEIGCVELVNYMPTGQNFHCYINPERDMPEEAAAVHGLTEVFLADKPTFRELVDSFIAFIGDAPLVIHNAPFDMKFLNAELMRLGYPALPADRAVDTLLLARRRYPGAQASLDALCRRFDIDLSARDRHGALLDAELLAAVYLELRGGREPGLGLAAERRQEAEELTIRRPTRVRPPRPHAETATEVAAHGAFLAKLTDPLWLDI